MKLFSLDGSFHGQSIYRNDLIRGPEHKRACWHFLISIHLCAETSIQFIRQLYIDRIAAGMASVTNSMSNFNSVGYIFMPWSCYCRIKLLLPAHFQIHIFECVNTTPPPSPSLTPPLPRFPHFVCNKNKSDFLVREIICVEWTVQTINSIKWWFSENIHNFIIGVWECVGCWRSFLLFSWRNGFAGAPVAKSLNGKVLCIFK